MIFDVREWFQGAKKGESLDWPALLPKAPVMRNCEVPDNSLVGVIHGVGCWGKEGDYMVNLNLFAVVLAMSPGYRPTPRRK